eukprot:TRINITY_DN22482_c0_g1_i2.p1 TRINITY_DN22482_c0_g1~~TRINITY_DN22482_c0_g1_i2.p1  ORF type:complete len:225 (-),score=54.81 TRINITY_DN22482_c0_g1_i2:265-903(-)
MALKRRGCEDTASSAVHLFPMKTYCGVSGSTILEAMHEGQMRHPIREVWNPKLRLPKQLTEYISAVCQDFPPEIRQEALLLLKRFVWQSGASGGEQEPSLQVIALTCANLACKHWQQQGIAEQQLHWLSRNAFTRQDFIDAEVKVLHTVNCNVHWEGVLLAEWVPMLLYLSEDFLAEASDMGSIIGVASHLADILSFQVGCRFASRHSPPLH